MRRWAVAAAAALTLIAGCGDDGRPRLVVSAAASLFDALTRCARQFEGADVRLSFAGSDELAAQIRRGVKPDVYVAANTALPEQLAREGLLERAVEFAGNELVVAVPGDDPKVSALADLARPGVEVVIGAESVPVGSYARAALARLPAEQRRAILANVRSEEPDVRGVVGKLARAAADAGFVYRTDLVDGLQAIALPAELRPAVAYGAGVVTGSAHPQLARRYVDGLTAGACADALRAAGFDPPRGT